MDSKKRTTVQQFIRFFIMFCGITGVAVYLEFLGWRILDSGFSLSQVFEQQFLFGILRTLGGAVIFGGLLLLFGMIPKKLRDWTVSNSITIWSVGAAVFLMCIAGLVLWAYW